MKIIKLLLILLLLFIVSCSNSFKSEPEPTLTPLPTHEPCLAGGDQNTINDRLKFSGSEAVLCQGAVFELKSPVFIDSARQKIYTEGFPEDDRRAVLRIVSEFETTAIQMRDSDEAVISHIIIDGNRPNLGYREGDALVYAGGDSRGQVIRAVKITEPRSWSALHLIEPCTEALVEDSEIGPAGISSWMLPMEELSSLQRQVRLLKTTSSALKPAPCWAESTWWNQNFTMVTLPARSYRTISSKLLEQSSELLYRWAQGSGCAWMKEKPYPHHMAALS